MQSEMHETLFKRLLAITAETRSALHNADPVVLEKLVGEQRSVMEELSRIGPGRDAALLDLAKEVQAQILAVLSEVRERHRAAGEALSQHSRRRKQINAYRQVKKGNYR